MGYVQYTVHVTEDDLKKLLGSSKLPASLQNAIRALKLNPKELPVEGREAGWWKMTLQDDFKGKMEVVSKFTGEGDASEKKFVFVDCYFDQAKEAEYFLDKQVGYLKKYNSKPHVAELEKEVGTSYGSARKLPSGKIQPAIVFDYKLYY